jgi:hypothetical protein
MMPFDTPRFRSGCQNVHTVDEQPPATRRFSRTPGGDELVDGLVSAATEACLSHTPAPRAVLLQGSCALGEACIVREPDGSLTMLSDLDLAVVVASADEREAWRRIAATWPAEAALLPGADAVMSGWSLGVYALEDLPRQPPKMGSVELARGSLVLAGDPTVRDLVRPADGVLISPEESFRLVAVRAAEQLAAREAWSATGSAGGPAHSAAGIASRRLVSTSLKLVSDLGTALLAATGRYIVGANNRAVLLQKSWLTQPLAELAEAFPPLPETIARATAARQAGGTWDDLARAAGYAGVGLPELAACLDRGVVEPFRAVAPWLLDRLVDATAGALRRADLRDESGTSVLSKTVRKALASARPRGAIRTWFRLARHTGDMSSRMEILRLAALHRFSPAPWLVGACLTCLALSATTDPTGAALAMGEDCWGRSVESPGGFALQALRAWRLLSVP